MRVLFVNRELTARGGAGRWLLDLLAGLQGHAETLLLVGRDDGSVTEEERKAIGPWLLVRGVDAGRPGRSPRKSALDRFRSLVDEFRPRLVHGNDVLAPELLESIAATGRGVLTVQDHRLFCPGRGKLDRQWRICRVPMSEEICRSCFDDAGYAERLLALTRRRLACLADMKAIVVLSRYMARELELVGVPARLIRVVPPAAAESFLKLAGPARGKGNHLFAGRLAHHKGIEVALQAARRLPAGGRLLVAGDGPLAGMVAEAALQPENKVVFLGWQDRPGLIRLLSKVSSAWMPSLWPEPFGIAGIEALAAGVPVIGSATGAIPEWLEPGQVGYLVKPAEHDILSQLAAHIDSNPTLAARLGREGRRLVRRRYTMKRKLLDIIETYKSCV